MKDDFEKSLDALLETIEEDIEVDDEFIPRSANTLHSMTNRHDYFNVDITYPDGYLPDLPIIIPSMTIVAISRPYTLGDKTIEPEVTLVTEKETSSHISWGAIISTRVLDHVIDCSVIDCSDE